MTAKKKKKRFRIRRKTRRIIGIAIAAAILAGVLFRLFYQPAYEIKPSPYTVKYDAAYQYIHDGDTAVFLIDTGEIVTCRFLAVDTPEIGEEGYEEAKHFTDVALEKASKIVLELDPSSERYDKYDRLLAWVWADGRLMQAELIRNGYAKLRYIYHDYLYLDELENLQKNVTQPEKETDDR